MQISAAMLQVAAILFLFNLQTYIKYNKVKVGFWRQMGLWRQGILNRHKSCTYNKAGGYTVSLMVKNENGTDMEKRSKCISISSSNDKKD